MTATLEKRSRQASAATPEARVDTQLRALFDPARSPELLPTFDRRLQAGLRAQRDRQCAKARQRRLIGLLLTYGLLVIVASIWILVAAPWPSSASSLPVFLLAAAACLAWSTGLAFLVWRPLRLARR